MDDRLNLLMAELLDIEVEVESMICILDMLDELYERKRQFEIRCNVLVVRGWLKQINYRIGVIADGIDKYSLEASKAKHAAEN